ncbi:MAG: YCF48-related protein [Bacteroidota bacterium]
MAVLLTQGFATFAQWNWVNPKPQGNTIRDIKFTGSTTAVAAGDCGTILKTTDGGNNWTRMESGTLEGLNSLFFLDSSVGYAISDGGSGLYKTTDGGSTWNLDFTFDTFNMYGVWFTSPMHGIAVGEEAVFVTNNGGITWSWNAPYTWNYSIWFTDASTAIMASDGYMYKSYDAGNTWTVKHTGINAWKGSLYFMNATTGVHVGRSGQICRTDDAGENWYFIPSGTSHDISAAFILPSGTGYAVGDSGTILKTTNSGNSWISMPPVTDYNLRTIAFSDDHNGVIMGQDGLLMITVDGGATWMNQTSCFIKKNLDAVFFPTQNTGYIAGANATLLKSTDGGNNWQPLPVTTNAAFYSLFFTDAQTGYVSGAYGSVYKTLNGGGSWSCLTTGVSHDLRKLDFPDDNTGYALGYSLPYNDTSYLLRTTNAGNTWISRRFDGTYANAIAFTSPDTGYVAGKEGRIMQTTNGGVSWSQQGYFPTTFFNDICFPSVSTGFAAGSNAICQTHDAGLHWSLLYSGQISFNRIEFTDLLNGFALGYDQYYIPILYKTEDGGLTWSNKPVDQTCTQINDIFFSNAETGFIAGNNGIILKTGNSGGIVSGIKPGRTQTGSSIKIYPNPCTDRVRVQLPGQSEAVDFSLYSLIGEKLFSSVFSHVESFTVALPPLAAGSCLARIRTDTEVTVRKLVITRNK